MPSKTKRPTRRSDASRIERPLGPYVGGFGPEDADLMYIGEGPGRNEEEQGRPFVGKTGIELRRYHTQAKIPVDYDDCYFSNVVKHRPFTNKATGNVQPTAKEIARDTPELVQEIEMVRPTFICAVGAVAARWLLGGVVDLESVHGFPFATFNHRATRAGMGTGESEFGGEMDHRVDQPNDQKSETVGGIVLRKVRGRTRTTVREDRRDAHGAHDGDRELGRCDAIAVVAHFIVVPCYHPAYGFHDSDAQRDILDDFMSLGKYMRGELPIETPRDEHPDPDYYEPKSVVLIRTRPVAIDTEGLRGRAWGLSYTQIAGSAGVIRA